MTESTPDQILVRAQVPSANGRPVRKDEIELHDRGLYIESWLPERRSRRKPLLFVHGELAGSWLWERYLGLLRLARLGGPRPQPPEPPLVADGRSARADVHDVRRRRRRGAQPPRADDGGHRPRAGRAAGAQGRGAGADRRARPARAGAARRAAAEGPAARAPRRAGRLRPRPDRLGHAAREAPARPSRPDPRRRPPDPAPARPEAARERPRRCGPC